MKLLAFEAQNFRSIANSGEVAVGHTTTLVGRNESGKSNLLIALHSMNPAGGRRDLTPIKDFPRSRRLSECTNETEVVKTTWELDEAEQAHLAGTFPRAKDVKKVIIKRHYNASSVPVEFADLKPLEQTPTKTRVNKIAAAVREAASKLDENPATALRAATDTFATTVSFQAEPKIWAASAAPALAAFRQALRAAGVELEPREDGLLAELESEAADIAKDEPAMKAAEGWVRGRIPTFIYIADYPELVGHQNIAEYLKRKSANPFLLTDADRNFEKMCKVADLDPQQLETLRGQHDHETRNQLTNRASAIVTSELRRLWKDRQLKVRFSPDAEHLDTFISDPNTVYDVEVNLDERSRGLKWFFSFHITFSADTKGGPAENAILLLDEPGLHLHAASQGDLLAHLRHDFKNQIIYTTHSPFMVPTDRLDEIRTVNIDQEAGTTVSKTPTGDAKTLFPIQAALGYSLAQSLFVGPNNLVVEGVTDFWIISCISDYLASNGKKTLPSELTLTPAGGAPKIPYMVALLSSERLNVFALLDDEKAGRAIRDDIVKSKLIREENVIFVTEVFDPKKKPTEADIEDVLGADVYGALVEESYKTEFKGKTLALNKSVPRIVKRYEEAFSTLGIPFHKTRPARLLLERMATDPQSIVTTAVTERFERLFERFQECFDKHRAREAGPFR